MLTGLGVLTESLPDELHKPLRTVVEVAVNTAVEEALGSVVKALAACQGDRISRNKLISDINRELALDQIDYEVAEHPLLNVRLTPAQTEFKRFRDGEQEQQVRQMVSRFSSNASIGHGAQRT